MFFTNFIYECVGSFRSKLAIGRKLVLVAIYERESDSKLSWIVTDSYIQKAVLDSIGVCIY